MVSNQRRPSDTELLATQLNRIDLWLQRLGPDNHGFKLAPGSELASDDLLLDPYQGSNAAWTLLSHAVDHLHMLRTAVIEARTLQMFAPYSLLRVALENACAAVWLLAPDAQNERVQRRLQHATGDVRNGERVKQLIGRPGPRTQQEQVDQLKSLAAAAGLDPREATTTPTYLSIVQSVGVEMGDPQLLELLWRMGSGIAHGDIWATLSVPDRVELPSTTPGIANMSVTASWVSLITMTMTAADVIERAWLLFSQRSK